MNFLEDYRKDYNVMKYNFAGPSIIKDEIRAAISKIKLGKATGPDNISLELFKALEDYRIDKTATSFNKIYDQVRFHYTYPNLYLQPCQRNQGQQ